LILLGTCIFIGVGIGFINQFLPQLTSRPSGGAEAVNVGKLTTFDSPPTVPADYTAVQEGGTPLLTVLPNQLLVADETFSVVPVSPEQGRWPIPDQQLDVAVWVHGTVVNYVVGIPYTQSTESLLASLGSEERIQLTLDNGTTLVFGAPESQRIAADDLTPMSQQQPGLTLVLLGSSKANRLIVRARYLPEESYAAEGKQHVDGLILEVLKSGVVQDTGDTRHFVVEYRITNESTVAVNPDFFDMTLENDAGQRYPINAEVSAAGQYGPLQTVIDIGASVMGSAGYLIPRDTQAPITWVFRADPASTNPVRNILPYEPPLPIPAQPVVELTAAFADGVRNSIVINGVVRNTGETALTVTLDDVTLTSSAGNSSLQASAPLLPWPIEGGASMDFEVQFSRPAGVTSVLLDILGFTFQIEGLP
jgi:hypothetical protein